MNTALNKIKNKVPTKHLLTAAGVVIAILILLLHNQFYIPYFFSELDELHDDKRYILTNTNNKTDKFLIKGILPLNNNEIVYNTVNIKSQKYVKLSKSINNQGGSQFSYSFWMNKYSADEPSNYANRIILLKGLKAENVIVKAPLIKFGNNSDELVIEFNTSKNDKRITIDETKFNLTSGNKWFLVTVVFQDFVNPDDNFEEGIYVSVYLNDSLINSGYTYKDHSLRLNNSPLYILPNVNNSDFNSLSGKLCDMRYHNYALSQMDIKDLYNNSLNEVPFKTALDLKMNTDLKSSQKKLDLKLINET